MNAEDVIALLKLKPLEPEGGYFLETYKSTQMFQSNIEQESPKYDSSARALMTAIYYLITGSNFSAFHRLKNAEIYHFYDGSPMELFEIRPDGTSRISILGRNLRNGEQPQLVVEPGVWQASRIVSDQSKNWSLVGTTVSPGFDFADFELGSRQELLQLFPDHRDLIFKMTRT